jgi:hypothetical protein
MKPGSSVRPSTACSSAADGGRARALPGGGDAIAVDERFGAFPHRVRRGVGREHDQQAVLEIGQHADASAAPSAGSVPAPDSSSSMQHEPARAASGAISARSSVCSVKVEMCPIDGSSPMSTRIGSRARTSGPAASRAIDGGGEDLRQCHVDEMAA